MFGRSMNVFRLHGIQVRADASWLILALLIVWSLASSVFPYEFPQQAPRIYWLMGILGAIGLFASIVAHEFAHALTARRFQLPVQSITLFVFGGVAEMEDEPARPAAEFWMAIAGPMASVLIAVGFALFTVAGQAADGPWWIRGTLSYLVIINLLLAAFNLIPAFPLDGGRMLRAGLWHWKGNLRWATQVAGGIGAGFGVVLIILGVFRFISGDFIGGMWWGLIGLFLRSAAQTAYRQLLIRGTLGGEPVSRFMNRDVHTVPPAVSIAQFVEDYIYRYHHKFFPVAQNGDLHGCITVRQVQALPRDQWPQKTVAEVCAPCTEAIATSPSADAMQTLLRMNRLHVSRLMVIEHGHLEGILSLKDLMGYVTVKLRLSEAGGRPDSSPGIGGRSDE